MYYFDDIYFDCCLCWHNGGSGQVDVAVYCGCSYNNDSRIFCRSGGRLEKRKRRKIFQRQQSQWYNGLDRLCFGNSLLSGLCQRKEMDVSPGGCIHSFLCFLKLTKRLARLACGSDHDSFPFGRKEKLFLENNNGVGNRCSRAACCNGKRYSLYGYRPKIWQHDWLYKGWGKRRKYGS